MGHTSASLAISTLLCGTLAAAEPARLRGLLGDRSYGSRALMVETVPSWPCGGRRQPVCSGENMEGRESECDTGFTPNPSGKLCIRIREDVPESEAEPEDIPQWYCAAAHEQKWCDGVCIDAGDDRDCAVVCGPDVFGEAVPCETGTTDNGKMTETPDCCNYSTHVWCEAESRAENDIPGLCVAKGDVGTYACKTTCTSESGTLSCDPTPSKGTEWAGAGCIRHGLDVLAASRVPVWWWCRVGWVSYC